MFDSQKWYERNKEHHKENMKQYYEKNKKSNPIVKLIQKHKCSFPKCKENANGIIKTQYFCSKHYDKIKYNSFNICQCCGIDTKNKKFCSNRCHEKYLKNHKKK